MDDTIPINPGRLGIIIDFIKETHFLRSCICADSGELSAPLGSDLSSTMVGDVSAADYLERLKVLRARCGLDNDVNTRSDSVLSDVAVSVTKSHTQTLHDADAGISAVSVSVSHHCHQSN